MLTTGMTVPISALCDIDGRQIDLCGTGRWTLLSFLRYASCPSCLLYVRDLIRRHETLEDTGIDTLVVFHSPPRRIRRHTSRLAPRFGIVADPDRVLYRQFHVETSWPKLMTSFLRPSFLPAYAKSLVYGFWGGAVDGDLARMPADFLIDDFGTIRHIHYGKHIGDHLDLTDVLVLRRNALQRAGAA